MRTKGASNWTPEREARLRQLWDVEGRSGSQCAEALGVTRNAVIGKAVRMKLRRRPELVGWSKTPLAKRVPAASILHGNAWRALPGARPVALLDLVHDMCRWPIGEGRPFLFCGLKATDGSYCAHHAAISAGHVTPVAEAA